jgi:hypothetical protein
MKKIALLIWFAVLLVLVNMAIIMVKTSNDPSFSDLCLHTINILDNLVAFLAIIISWLIFPYTVSPHMRATKSVIGLFISRSGTAIMIGFTSMLVTCNFLPFFLQNHWY